MLKVAIIILHYQNWADTRACLGSLKKLKKLGFKVQIIVVNNSPDQEIKDKVKHTYPSATYLKTKRNLGFAAGNNLGIKRALKDGADYVMLLNNDTVVGPTTVRELVKVFKQNSQAGIVGPVIKHQIKKGMRFDYGGRINWLLGKTYHLNRVDHRNKKVEEREFVSGCCMLIKAEVFKKIGLLDEAYFLYLEDVDFCTKARQAGFKVLHNPKAKIFHKGSQAASSWTNLKYNFINSLRFSWRWVNWPLKICALIYQFVFHSLLLGRYSLRAVI